VTVAFLIIKSCFFPSLSKKDLNNTVYNGIYVSIMLVLACTLGLLFSITMAIVTALIEFLNLFVLRPTAKILKIILDYLVCILKLFIFGGCLFTLSQKCKQRIPVYLLANLLAPFLEKIFPGSYKNLKVPMFAMPTMPIHPHGQ